MSTYTKIKDRQAGAILDCMSCENRTDKNGYREVGCGAGKTLARCRSYKSDRLIIVRKKTPVPELDIWKL